MLEKNDWRLTCQENFLKNAKLIFRTYKTNSSHWDHDHCAFCWDKFSEVEGDLHEGYSTADNKHWICKDCFNDFKEMFNFEVISED